jgi:hypothetical protein
MIDLLTEGLWHEDRPALPISTMPHDRCGRIIAIKLSR